VLQCRLGCADRAVLTREVEFRGPIKGAKLDMCCAGFPGHLLAVPPLYPLIFLEGARVLIWWGNANHPLSHDESVALPPLFRGRYSRDPALA
jgi:hypothetical protein